ncbi:GABA transporter 1-like isoform X1 [Cucurbita pepo subsp. pepo]|uniref:GABA transporter 1-like isoform X1 n=1 Tax=Cucurbita pepo subsp. pepo TaxID=3664 RepID=UPI000C9D6D5B|nr:GABA transporter 1-like isoform X1 [Cucurbita pepo subsp. pepo]
MGAKTPTSVDTMAKEKENGDGQVQVTVDLDAGALFVLKSRGSWWHCGYHLTTSIVAPSLLSLPFAFKMLGWVGGSVGLAFCGLVTFYAYHLLSLVLEHHAMNGSRLLRFRDMATNILGPKWGTFYVGPIQFGVCYGSVVAGILIGGQNMKYIYVLSNPEGTMKLYQFIIIFGSLILILAQIPSFHSLRHINLLSLTLSLAYSACVTVASLILGYSKNAPPKDYSVQGSAVGQLFNAFNGISVIATSYACGMVPEIQATLVAPLKGKMFKGLCLCYAVIAATFLSVGISGYWAFGNEAKGTVLTNFMGQNQLPSWLLIMTNAFCLVQVSAVTGVYLQPTNELFEKKLADPTKKQFSTRNIVPRLISRSLTVIIATIFSSMLPFFGDLMGLIGALGFIPLDFIMPMVFYNATFKPSKRTFIFWINSVIVAISSVLAAIGGVAAIRQIVLDAKEYRLFANV